MSDPTNERPTDDYIDNPPTVADALVDGMNELSEPRNDEDDS